MSLLLFLIFQTKNRNRNKNSLLRSGIKIDHSNLIHNNVINHIHNDKSQPFHAMIELSNKQWMRYCDNSLHVKGLYEHKTIDGRRYIQYSNVVHGKNLEYRKRSCRSNGGVLRFNLPSIRNMAAHIIFIVADKEEILNHSPETLILDGSSQQTEESKNDSSYIPSGKIILFMGRIETSDVISKYVWGKEEATFLNNCKDNLIKAHSSHFGSIGKYYSFGNRANYGMIGKSSVTQYVNKKFKSEGRNYISKIDSEYIEKIVGRELIYSVECLSKIIKNLKKYMGSAIDVAFNIQEQIGTCNITETQTSGAGLWQSSVSVNAQTTKLHTENDMSYTLITVPRQKMSCDILPEYNFLFELMDRETLGIKLDPGMSFIFTGKFLTHRQSLNENKKNSKEIFINLASYSNERLHNHIKTTIKRVLE